MASPSTIFSMLCPPCAAAPFAERTRPIDNARDGVRFLNRSMFEILRPLASERDCFETGRREPGGVPRGEQTSFRVLGLVLSRPDEAESIYSEAISPPRCCE